VLGVTGEAWSEPVIIRGMPASNTLQKNLDLSSDSVYWEMETEEMRPGGRPRRVFLMPASAPERAALRPHTRRAEAVAGLSRVSFVKAQGRVRLDWTGWPLADSLLLQAGRRFAVKRPAASLGEDGRFQPPGACRFVVIYKQAGFRRAAVVAASPSEPMSARELPACRFSCCCKRRASASQLRDFRRDRPAPPLTASPARHTFCAGAARLRARS
jgi:hypothetical protein